MPDIRYSPMLDAMTGRPDEDPLYYGGRWITMPGSNRLALASGDARIPDLNNQTAASHWYAPFFGLHEWWAFTHGVADLSEEWRMGFCITNPLAGFLGFSGYALFFGAPVVGSQYWALARYDNGFGTGLAATNHSTPGIALMRRTATTIQCWEGVDPNTWNLILEATDTTYYAGYGFIGASSDDPDPGWSGVGGGRRQKTRIIRYVSN
jgi:hypothetical protein